MGVAEKLKKIYYNKSPLSESEMQTSRNISVYEGCTARSILTLTSGAFLVGFAKYLGANDQIAGIIAAVPVLTGMITAFSPVIYEKMENRKFLTCLLCFIGRLLLGCMIIVPFIKTEYTSRITLLIFMFATANLFLSFTIPASQAWILSITPEKIRGYYFGKRESMVLAAVTVITLIMGQVLDKYERAGNQLKGFVILYTFVICIALINFVIFSGIKEPKNTVSKSSFKLSSVLTLPIKNKKYMLISLILIVWNMGFQLAAPFTAVYMRSQLQLNYGLITLLAVVASVSSVLSVRYWGRLADRKSWLYLLKLMLLLQVLCFVIWFWTNKSTFLVLLPIAHIISGSVASGMNICINNIQYIYAPTENKTVYLGFSSAVNGIFGFSGTLIGSMLLNVTQNFRGSLLGIDIGNVQLIFLFAALVLIAGVLLVKLISRYLRGASLHWQSLLKSIFTASR